MTVAFYGVVLIDKLFSKPTRRTGAICRDGARSYSKGQGTASHHGGVDYWLIEKYGESPFEIIKRKIKR